MRIISLLVLVMSSVPAFAVDMVCEDQVSPTRFEFALINTWPEVRIQTGSKDCVGNGGFGFCVERGEDIVVGDDQVCGYRMNTNFECQTREFNNGRNHVIDTDCRFSGVKARLQVNGNGRGRIVCSRNGRVEQTWNYSSCN